LSGTGVGRCTGGKTVWMGQRSNENGSFLERLLRVEREKHRSGTIGSARTAPKRPRVHNEKNKNTRIQIQDDGGSKLMAGRRQGVSGQASSKGGKDFPRRALIAEREGGKET